MATCHICGKSAYEEHGIEFYSGSVRHVPTSVWFWELVLSNESVDERGGLQQLIQQKMQAWRVGAYICDDCHDELMSDCVHDLPKDNETIRHQLVSAAAGKAWENRYGRWPAGIKKPTPPATAVPAAQANTVRCNKCGHIFDNKLWACPQCGHTRLDNLISLFVLTLAFISGAVVLVLTRHYVWAALVGVIGIALVITSGPEIRKLWQARKG